MFGVVNVCPLSHAFPIQVNGLGVTERLQMTTWVNAQWQQANVCAACGMVITNRWNNHKIYKECEKELAKKVNA